MAKKQKYYVVWHGNKPGIYMSWDECKAQITGFAGSKYKSFDTLALAEYAYSQNYEKFILSSSNKTMAAKKASKEKIITDSICVDAACSGNPGDLEYRGVETLSRKQLFHQGPFKEGTNNIGEFLAIIYALAALKKVGNAHTVIYSDSQTAISWVKNKKVKTTLARTPGNSPPF
ncbi:MAG: ribonuclease H-like protein [Bacteroidetes bacterium OLB9]|nr:MAG: ribonuclease H-like protein [Bacteroidetes bacterium OLB9]